MLFESSRFAVSTCQNCAELSNIHFSIFNLSGRKSYKASCHEKGCGEPIWEITKAKDKYKITVNCPACDEVHTYTMSRKSFWGKKYFSFNCPTWEVGILYFGTDEKFIMTQLNMQDDYINNMLADVIDYDDSFNTMYELIENINDMSKSGDIECLCDNADIAIGIEENKIILTCKNCNRKKIIPATEENIDILADSEKIVLDDTTL